MDGAPFRVSVGHGTVRFWPAAEVEATAVGAAEVGGEDVGAVIVGVAVDLGVLAFVDGAAAVEAMVEGREVVLRTAGDAVTCGACVAVFATIVEVDESAERPGIVGTVDWAAVGADALTAGDAPPGGAGVAACAAQMQRPTTAKRRSMDFTNSLTVQLRGE